MASEQCAENRSQNEFLCVDSAPKKYASLIPVWRAPAVCLAFVLFGFGSIYAVNQIPALNAAFPNDDIIFSPYVGTHCIPLRLFIVSFSASFCCFCNGETRHKIALFIDIVLTFAFYCAVFDLINIAIYKAVGLRYPLGFIEIVSGLLGFWVFSLKLLRRGRMPPKISVPYTAQRTGPTLARLVGGAGLAAFASVWVASLDLQLVEELRSYALLGGIGPGVFLFLPVLFLIWFALATCDRAAMKTGDFAPPLTFVVPAHNEEYIIADTIFAIDAAAANYGGDVMILIMNNNSEDRTGEIAEAALADCKAAGGRVIDVAKPGKSNALNTGLEATQTDYFVRVDADTLIAPDSIRLAMRYFYDDKVGVVGGLPMPPGGALFDNARFLEVIVKHGYYSVALGAINGVVGVPGMLALYRTELPRRLGGFVEGMNGEDTDMSLRIGEMGYDVVVDPKVTYVSEVPATYKHMREQRMRWFRSIYHISSRNADYLDRSWMTIRGKIILPYMLVNSARRAMLAPLVTFGAIEYATTFNSANTLEWQAVLAVLIGAPAVVAVFATLINGYPKGILALPDYLVFRAIRAYLTLESLLSIIIAPDPEQEKTPRNTGRFMRPPPRRLKAAAAGAALSAALAANAQAGAVDAYARLSLGAERRGVIVEEDDVMAGGLATAAFVDGALLLERRMRKADFLRAAGSVNAQTYPGDASLNALRPRAEVAYRRRLFADCRCWAEAAVRYDRKWRDGARLFRQHSVRATLQLRHGAGRISAVRIGAVNLDYNDARLAGFDQRRQRIDVTHQWTSGDKTLRFSGRIYLERADADAARFGYRAAGAQATARVKPGEKTTLHAVWRWRERRYQGVFSNRFPVFRNDARHVATFGASRRVSENLSVNGQLGWDRNRSNVDIRDYEGLTFRLSINAELFTGE